MHLSYSRAIVFTQSKDRAKDLARELQGDGLRLGLVHAGMSDSVQAVQVDISLTLG